MILSAKERIANFALRKSTSKGKGERAKKFFSFFPFFLAIKKPKHIIETS